LWKNPGELPGGIEDKKKRARVRARSVSGEGL
jgi:hypothetical protein